ncbi:hypothetical protein T12_6145 [Trichinella patagoniensis]|uniref:Uncharacterized protein n=1 Tax=Trichinella patagoniensis TaxID=990121 RepID=A0A0V0ZIF8_9BILA|nr:hypothetical protein T12_6145 [Trichinella patagoniensis]
MCLFVKFLPHLAMQWFIILHLNKSIRNLWCIGSVELNCCSFACSIMYFFYLNCTEMVNK